MNEINESNYLDLIQKATNYIKEAIFFESKDNRYTIELNYQSYNSTEERVYFIVSNNHINGVNTKFSKSINIIDKTPYDLICFYRNSLDKFLEIREKQNRTSVCGPNLFTLEKQIELLRAYAVVEKLDLKGNGNKEYNIDDDNLFFESIENGKFESTDSLTEE